ncbi:RICIN domain-containing protein [Paenibacillus sp. GCM10027627]|uniref:RICIN domain-containing protein n=1 Tax=unclassified Paenibacillus TaxID=185978 RepID=UPI00363EE75E
MVIKNRIYKLLVVTLMGALFFSMIPGGLGNKASGHPYSTLLRTYYANEAQLLPCPSTDCPSTGTPQIAPNGSVLLNGGKIRFAVEDIPLYQNYDIKISYSISNYTDTPILLKNIYDHNGSSEVTYSSVVNLPYNDSPQSIVVPLKSEPGMNYIEISSQAVGLGNHLSINSISVLTLPRLSYIAHFDNTGWVGPFYDGDTAYSGSNYLQAITFQVEDTFILPPGTQLQYRAYVQGIGWQSWVSEGEMAGTVGQHRRLEALEMRLLNAPNHQIRYRSFVQVDGHQDWKQNGETSGTTGQNKKIYNFQAGFDVIPNVAKIINKNSNKAMDAEGYGTADGTRIHIWNYHGGNNQQWQFIDNGDGYYRIVGVGSGKAVEVANGGTADGNIVLLWPYWGHNHQLWKIVRTNDGYYKFINKHSGKALDVTQSGTANGTKIQQWQDNGSDAQKWQIGKLN